jgi:hypothetical protein
MVITAPLAVDTDESIIERAVELGTEAGRSAASWRFDGNTSTETYRVTLGLIEDGDPAFEIPEFLNDEWGGISDETLALALGTDLLDADDWLVNESCNQYIDAAVIAYTEEVERVCRLHLS